MDGGNVWISVDGRAYSLIPASAFLFNPYNQTLVTAAAGNTNPLAGQPAFTGTDADELRELVGHVDRRPGGDRGADPRR